MRKISLALDPGLVEDLDYLSKRLGVSRSSLVSESLRDQVRFLRQHVEMVPESPTEADMVRFRGYSAALVRERLASLEKLAEDMFSDDDGK